MLRCVKSAVCVTFLILAVLMPSVALAESPGSDVEASISSPQIEGSQPFIQRTQWAMRWIEKAGWSSFVGQNLVLIKESPSSPFLGALGLTPDRRGVAVFQSAPEDLWWYASAIVHEAAHARDLSAGRKYWGPEGEHAADLEQQRLLDALRSPMKVVREPATIADSPAPRTETLQSLAEGRFKIGME